MKDVTVNAEALYRILRAITGPNHHILELKYTRSLPDNPIDVLIDDYNDEVRKYNASFVTDIKDREIEL